MRDRIELILDRLSPAERKVAVLVAADPGGTMTATVASLAKAAGVSEPTVVRFCRSLGYEGFADLRLALTRADAVAEGGAAPRPPRHILPGMPATDAPAAVLDAAIAALEGARRHIDAVTTERAALALVRATRVEVWAQGASAGAAKDLAFRLSHLCRAVAARADPQRQAMAAAAMDGDGVALCLSHGGRAREVVEAARLARAAGATVIAITRPGSPLAASAQLLIPCLVEEEEAPHAPALSRLVQMALGDALCVAVALLSPPATAERMARVQAALTSRTIDP